MKWKLFVGGGVEFMEDVEGDEMEIVCWWWC